VKFSETEFATTNYHRINGKDAQCVQSENEWPKTVD